LWRASGSRATVLHGLTSAFTLAAALGVAVQVNRGGPLAAVDGLLRADALSAWMIALIGVVAALAATEAPAYLRPDAPGRFYPLFHLFVFTMLLAVSTDDVGLMWVAIEGTTLASVFLVNFEFARRILLALGLVSIAVAAAFLWTSTNYKRTLAYSSVEHIGLVCLGLGFGGVWGTAGALLHIANHALAKSVLFVLSGRIRKAYGSTEVASVSGLMAPMPFTGGGFLAAMLALVGLPPFGLFVSEVMIFAAGFTQGFPFIAAVGLILFVIAFAGLLRTTHAILYGAPSSRHPVVEAGG